MNQKQAEGQEKEGVQSVCEVIVAPPEEEG
jgi:hypothetical protein